MRSTSGDTGEITLTAGSNRYARHDGGDFVADGFEKGNVVEITGFRKAGNNGKFISLRAVTPTELTLRTSLDTETARKARVRAVGAKVIDIPAEIPDIS